MKLARTVLILSAVVFAGTGVGYMVLPGTMLAVVGIEPAATAEFLIRTEGVALFAAAGLILAATLGTVATWRMALLALGLYYVLGSIVDVAGYLQSVVSWVSLPSAVVRSGAGIVCLIAAARLPAHQDDLPG